MILHKLIVGPLGVNCYILASDNKEAVVIDPGGDAEDILNLINENKLVIKKIILTHGHCDHIGACKEVAEATKAPICIHKEDEILLKQPSKNLSFLMGINFSLDLKTEELFDGQTILIDNLSLTILNTPGHTPGSISIWVSGLLFTGDLLFAGSVGRTDLSGGSFKVLTNSLKRVLNFPDETRVLPGHGEETTLGQEKAVNPFLKDLR
ncbi:MBL fold metallo-hydrolase [Candidatus Oleimmundimicrobium sp.]|uniref:MBL fold metallo-hydrolase n=1 Tax=Candidatus Oleimmundimicrobium sp. TaxID=3060597 RepID=UPI002728C451|nr:MBL fold metallo-hydrolase [Candidatus Oleimmundimicrobium sp.]MDO8886733.1 MBL fold metallo-hydrolase [Candidatus Oleimmundimicrobium sp.]